MSNPLKYFQERCARNQGVEEIKYKDHIYYVFHEIAYLKDGKLDIIVNDKSESITLEGLNAIWETREFPHPQYVHKALEKNIPAVLKNDKLLIIKYLKGEDIDIVKLEPKGEIPESVTLAEILNYSVLEPSAKKIKLGANGHDSFSEDVGIRNLGHGLNPEKILELRNKKKKHNKLSVVPGYDDSTLMEVDSNVKRLDPLTLQSRMRPNERTCYDRISFMEGHGADFKNFIVIYKACEEKRKSKLNNTNDSIKKSATSSQPASAQKPTGYNRYDQEKFNKHSDLDFQIKPNLTFHGIGVQSLVNSRNSTGGSGGIGQGVSSFSEIKPPAGPLASVNRSISSFATTPPLQQKRKSRTPIIIIPGSASSLITMFNATDILQDLTFKTSEEKRKEMKRPNETVVHRTKENGEVIPYKIVDNPTKFNDDEWDRVVAVFVQGPAWQFKNWRWNGDPVNIFSNVLGYHLKFDTDKPDVHIKQWSVNILDLSKTKRHLDKACLLKFWSTLDRWIVKHKPNLRF
uniref:CDC73_C domain-containing protein n=1 Tax=Rhabditophanes sp. KR3021 TaxID=114890 RepID=A0AC35TK76_9BILA